MKETASFASQPVTRDHDFTDMSGGYHSQQRMWPEEQPVDTMQDEYYAHRLENPNPTMYKKLTNPKSKSNSGYDEDDSGNQSSSIIGGGARSRDIEVSNMDKSSLVTESEAKSGRRESGTFGGGDRNRLNTVQPDD